jgi:hypothetical protein
MFHKTRRVDSWAFVASCSRASQCPWAPRHRALTLFSPSQMSRLTVISRLLLRLTCLAQRPGKVATLRPWPNLSHSRFRPTDPLRSKLSSLLFRPLRKCG